MQRLGGKVPGYAATIVKESEDKNHIEGIKVQKSEASQLEDFDGDSMFEDQSVIAEEVSEKI